jgi:hypothetical protein
MAGENIVLMFVLELLILTSFSWSLLPKNLRLKYAEL